MSGLPVEYEFEHDPSGNVTPNDRDGISARLNDAFAACDLTMDDYQGRLQALFNATTRAQLVPVLGGLPARYRSNEPAIGGDNPGTRPGEVAPLAAAPRSLVKAGVAAAGVLVVLIVLLVILL